MDLPSWRAFLVSLSSDADLSNEVFHGRVEHVQTGRRAAFASPGELQAFMALVLEEVQRHPRPGAAWEPESS